MRPDPDSVYVGPSDPALSSDLPLALGVPAEDGLAEAVDSVREACARNGIAASKHAPSAEWAKRHSKAGATGRVL